MSNHVDRFKKHKKYVIMSKQVNHTCEYCKGKNHTVRSVVDDEAVLSCNVCRNITSKLIEDIS